MLLMLEESSLNSAIRCTLFKVRQAPLTQPFTVNRNIVVRNIEKFYYYHIKIEVCS